MLASEMLQDLLPEPDLSFDGAAWAATYPSLAAEPPCQAWLRVVGSLDPADVRHQFAVTSLKEAAAKADREAARAQWIADNPEAYAAEQASLAAVAEALGNAE